MKSLQLDKFDGVRNDVSLERFSPRDLAKAINIELDETGKPSRRGGTTSLDDHPTHSLWAGGGLCLCVRDGSLQRLLPDLSFHDYGIHITGNRVSYVHVLDSIYWSDGLTTGAVSTTGDVREWGIAPPLTPFVNPAGGDLPPGNYLVTATYVRRDGLESGAAPVTLVTVGQSQHYPDRPSATRGGFSLTISPSDNLDVIQKRVYVSDTNGEVCYLAATLTNSENFLTVSALPSGRSYAVTTLRHGPMPAGDLLGYYNGRVYSAKNNVLWYSNPYEYELTHRAMNYISFTSPVRTFAPVSDGIFVGSDDETIFMRGSDPAEFVRHPVAPYGTVTGTEVEIPNYYFGKGDAPATTVQLWMSTKGLCAGLDGGQFVNLTGGRYVPPKGLLRGASLLKMRSESPQLVTTLFTQ